MGDLVRTRPRMMLCPPAPGVPGRCVCALAGVVGNGAGLAKPADVTHEARPRRKWQRLAELAEHWARGVANEGGARPWGRSRTAVARLVHEPVLTADYAQTRRVTV